MPRPRARIDPAAVTRAFAPDGLHGATTAVIARCAGVAKPTLYAHGASKESLFLACVETEVERLLSELSDAELRTRESPARVRLTALARAIIAHGAADPAAARLLHVTARHVGSGVADEVEAALARLPARVALALRGDAEPAEAERVAAAFLGAVGALAQRVHADPERDAALVGEAFAGAIESSRSGQDAEQVRSVGLY